MYEKKILYKNIIKLCQVILRKYFFLQMVKVQDFIFEIIYNFIIFSMQFSNICCAKTISNLINETKY